MAPPPAGSAEANSPRVPVSLLPDTSMAFSFAAAASADGSGPDSMLPLSVSVSSDSRVPVEAPTCGCRCGIAGMLGAADIEEGVKHMQIGQADMLRADAVCALRAHADWHQHV